MQAAWSNVSGTRMVRRTQPIAWSNASCHAMFGNTQSMCGYSTRAEWQDQGGGFIFVS